VFGRERPHRHVHPGVVRASTAAAVAFGGLLLALTLTAMVVALVA
jgi:hypothetical protein